MHGRPLVVFTLLVSLVPAGPAAAAPGEDELATPEGPAQAPVEAAPAAPVSAPPPPAAIEPEHGSRGAYGLSLSARF